MLGLFKKAPKLEATFRPTAAVARELTREIEVAGELALRNLGKDAETSRFKRPGRQDAVLAVGRGDHRLRPADRRGAVAAGARRHERLVPAALWPSALTTGLPITR